jgi:hypothetical protein
MKRLPKLPKELRDMGLMYTFHTMVDEWAKQNDLGFLELTYFLQDYQSRLMHSTIDEIRKDYEEVDE